MYNDDNKRMKVWMIGNDMDGKCEARYITFERKYDLQIQYEDAKSNNLLMCR